MKIENFTIDEKSRFIRWQFNKKAVQLQFNYKFQVIQLLNLNGIVLIEYNGSRNNATIYNSDGTIKCKVMNPDFRSLCFYDVCYIGEELTLIMEFKGGIQKSCVIDEDGRIIRTYETR